MNRNKFRKMLLPIGTLLTALGAGMKSIALAPDFVEGFCIGLGVTLVIGGFYITKFKKPKLS